MKEKIRGWYGKYYKQLFFLPILLIVVSLLILGNNYVQTGDIIDKDVSLKGGTTATIYTSNSYPGLEESLFDKFPTGDFVVRELNEFGSGNLIGVVVEVSNVDAEELEEALEDILGIELTPDNYSVEFVGSSLGESFYKQMLFAVLLAFLFMAIVVFVTFRVLVPSVAVVFAAFADMVTTIAVLSLFDVQLSTAGIAAILLLIGYSIDTDILLTTKLLKRKEGLVFDRLWEAMKTGLTMTCTTLAALTVGYFVASSFVLKQMFLIILVGLIFDVMMTYCFNAGLLIWYLKKKRRVE